MKYLLTILMFFVLTNSVNSQCEARLDTIKVKMDIKTLINIWDYYEPDGTPLWKGKKYYNEKLIPAGGWAQQREKNLLGVIGYVVQETRVPDEPGVGCPMFIINKLDSKKKPIKGFLLSHRPYNY